MAVMLRMSVDTISGEEAMDHTLYVYQTNKGKGKGKSPQLERKVGKVRQCEYKVENSGEKADRGTTSTHVSIFPAWQNEQSVTTQRTVLYSSSVWRGQCRLALTLQPGPPVIRKSP